MKQLHQLFILSIFLLFPLLCYGQVKIHSVEKASSLSEPIELVNLEAENKVFDAGNQVLANKDWLKTLSLKLKNTSGKTIVYMELELEIAPLGKMERPLRLPLQFGQMPSIESSENLKTVRAKVPNRLKPNKVVTVSLQPKFYDFLLRFMQENQIEDIERVKVFFEFVVFDDGTAWSKGHEMRRNPDNPRQWDVIGIWQKEFGKFQNRIIPNANQILTQANKWQWNKGILNLLKQASFFLPIVQRQTHSCQ